MKTLVIGCDASGKSTLIRGICECYGDTPIEASHSAKAVTFKANNLRTCMDAEFLNEREAFYLQLEAEEQPKTLTLTGNIITTNSTLITRLAHAVMRTCISEPCASDSEIISRWLEDEQHNGTSTPDTIAFTHAEPSVIQQRMIARQRAGRSEEAFWGFNSLFFLERYQNRCRELLAPLGALGIHCIDIDTSHAQPDALLAEYHRVRPYGA